MIIKVPISPFEDFVARVIFLLHIGNIVSSPSRNLQLHCKMGSWETTLQGLLILLVSTLTYQATIGDGRVSLYTGRAINSTEGRGSCLVDGLTYPSETAIPRDHPCHYCICYQSQVTCYWKQCAAAPRDCAVMHFENVCNPSLYMCQIPEKASRVPKRRFGDRIKGLKRRRFIRAVESSSLVPKSSSAQSALRLPISEPFPVKIDEALVARVERSLSRVRRAVDDHHHHHNDPHDKTCTILGVVYNLGEVIGVASDVCMECRCAAGKMFCSPRCCFLPSPLSLTSSQEHRLASRQLDPPKPHPLSYVRNQYEESPYLDLGPFF
ncbi:hypothetical protein Pmani_016730 [Petrolisthes manimaculis]|uniref:Uncharacterized protein n=1 Tax=Petrolisthes manimaculis TaxID=1843537 RepID=A0AAE1PNT3_9EUCA|nr:hypothetical protein Pmani_016730 [Petrolisthes manimaculis]